MKALEFIGKSIFTIILVLVAEISWAQFAPSLTSGSGIKEDPYMIASINDWNAFANDVIGGYSYVGEFVKLTSDIGTAETPVTTMVGNLVNTVYYSFKGTFDGNNKTLTFHYDFSELPKGERLDHVAPFRYISGATIKDLKVTGDINMDRNDAGGLFCVNDISDGSKSYITNCTVSVNVSGYKYYCGGFADDARGVTFTNCIYNGKLNIGKNCGGFSSNGNVKTIIDNCLCAPTEGSEIYSRSGNFVNNKNVIITDSYYTLSPNPESSILTQGTRAYTSEPAAFTQYKKLIDGNYYYAEGNATIINLPEGYDYTGDVISVTYGMTFDGTTLTETSDYTASFSPSPVLEMGEYTLTLSGNNSNKYYGSISQTFTVIDGHLEGGGTAEDPYLIDDAHDWTVLTNKVNYGTGVDSYYKLAKDITIGKGTPVNVLVGTTEHPFSGHFDGGWHTLTVNIDRTENYAAPFGVIDGATIENLKVAGTITTSAKYAGGIVAWVENKSSNETHITNCISAVNIISSVVGDGSHAGFVGQLQTGVIRFKNCAFEGSIIGADTEKCAGFMSWRGARVYYEDCTMAGTISVKGDIGTYQRKNADLSSFLRAYYINSESLVYDYIQGTEITSSAAAPTDGIYRKYTFSANDYYVQGGIISGMENTTFSYSGEEIDLAPTVTYYGWTLVEDTDYAIGLTYCETETGDYTPVTNIQEAGYYIMTITGINNYGGSIDYSIHVIDINTWSILKEELTAESGTVTIYHDLSDDSNVGALVVSKGLTIVLDLNGHTIDRKRESEETDGYVVKVEKDASLTIINGTVTGGWNNGSGGGIYNEGTLTLNGVVVTNNRCHALGGGVYCNGGSFNMTGGAIINNHNTHDGSKAGGGGIHAESVTAFEMNNVTVTENSTVSKGGGIRLSTGNIQTYINNCTITENVSGAEPHPQSKGGGIYYEATNNNATLNVNGGIICVNSVSQEGGAIYVGQGIVSVQGCYLAGNVSGSLGGAVSVYHGSSSKHGKVIINGCSINGNRSTNQGGGVYVYSGADIEILGETHVVGNVSTTDGTNNVYLAKSDGVIRVVGDISGAAVGVSRSGLGAITSGLGSYGTAYNFISDSESRWVMLNEGEANLRNYYAWGETGWPNLDGITKDDDDNYTINAVVTIPENTVVSANSITTGIGMLIIEEGGQVVTGSASSVNAEVKNTVDGSTADENGWYLISSPVANPSITGASNLIETNAEYDFYRFNEASDSQWENYKAGHADFTTLQNGRSYLYRNEYDHTLNISGTLNVSDVTYGLSYNATTAPSGNDNVLKGFNLIGNPYSHTIYKGSADSAIPNGELLESNYYVLDPETGGWVLTSDGSPIPPMTGILVQAKHSGDLTMKNSTEGYVAPSRNADDRNIWFTVANGEFEDKACVEFREGRGLNKMAHQNGNIPMLYISQDGEDFASVDLGENAKLLKLNFETKTTGRYTLSCNVNGGFSYLHLIDKVEGKDIDLLSEKEYSFIGSSFDRNDRFEVRLSLSDGAGDATFAYQNGDDIIVSGDGELLVFDLMGRMIAYQRVNGVQTVEKPSQTGVYVLKLNDKTQKIVIR